MTIRFEPLFTLGIANGYYTTASDDFQFLVPADSQRLLKNRKLLAKVRDGRVHVLFEADESGAPLVLAAGETVRIGLRLSNPRFFHFTDAAFVPGSITALYRNAASPTQLDALLQVFLVGNLLKHELTNAARPATVEVLDSADLPFASETVTASANRADVTFDLTPHAAGRYSVRETFPGNIQTVTRYYRDAELLPAGIFGLVEFAIDAGFYFSAVDFDIPFDAKQETLKYYVVTHKYSNSDLSQLDVTDQGFTDEARSEIQFTKVVAADFTAAELPPSLFGNSDAQVVLFKSQATVARRERARRKIQLKRNSKILIENLPQPGADQATADMIIHVVKP